MKKCGYETLDFSATGPGSLLRIAYSVDMNVGRIADALATILGAF